MHKKLMLDAVYWLLKCILSHRSLEASVEAYRRTHKFRLSVGISTLCGGAVGPANSTSTHFGESVECFTNICTLQSSVR